jgi:hypothetical protein
MEETKWFSSTMLGGLAANNLGGVGYIYTIHMRRNTTKIWGL